MDSSLLKNGLDGNEAPARPEASELLYALFSQSQLLAALYCLNKLEILPCVPPSEAVPLQDVAEMAGVPANQLAPIFRLAATAGFFCEPQPGFIAHTSLSEQFLRKPALVDVISFLGDTALPAALQMVNVTRSSSWALESNPRSSAYNYASQSSSSFVTDCNHQPKLRRQASAFQRLLLHHAFGNDHGIVSVLTAMVNFANLGPSTVVLVGCQSDAVAHELAQLNPQLHFVVQMMASRSASDKCSTQGAGRDQRDTLSQVFVQYCTSGQPPLVNEARLYILHLPLPSVLSPTADICASFATILQTHFDALRLNKPSRIILVAQGLQGMDAVGDRMNAAARMQDLVLMQMTGGCEPLSFNHIEQLLCGIRDANRRLVILRKEISENGLDVAIELGIGPL